MVQIMVKRKFWDKHGRYFCEICEFDFKKGYGCDFIECHHKIPLSELKKPKIPKVADFVVLCSNCHSVVHIERPAKEVGEVKSGDAEMRAIWLRQVQTKQADFLRSKFSYQHAKETSTE